MSINGYLMAGRINFIAAIFGVILTGILYWKLDIRKACSMLYDLPIKPKPASPQKQPNTKKIKGKKNKKIKYKSINVFLQPCNKNINKNVWNNCAKILSDKSDEELSPYLPELFRWLKDLNWPGAICIYDRLIISEDELFEYELKLSITTAKAQNDKLWLQALKNLKKERKARDK